MFAKEKKKTVDYCTPSYTVLRYFETILSVLFIDTMIFSAAVNTTKRTYSSVFYFSQANSVRLISFNQSVLQLFQ